MTTNHRRKPPLSNQRTLKKSHPLQKSYMTGHSATQTQKLRNLYVGEAHMNSKI